MVARPVVSDAKHFRKGYASSHIPLFFLPDSFERLVTLFDSKERDTEEKNLRRCNGGHEPRNAAKKKKSEECRGKIQKQKYRQ